MKKSQALKYFDIMGAAISHGIFGNNNKEQYLKSIKGRNKTEQRLLTKSFVNGLKKNGYKKIVDSLDGVYLGVLYGKTKYSLDSIINSIKTGKFNTDKLLASSKQLIQYRNAHINNLKQDVGQPKGTTVKQDVNLVGTTNNNPSEISTGIIAQTNKEVGRAKQLLGEIYQKNKQALDTKYKMQDIKTNVIDNYDVLHGLLQNDVQLGNNTAAGLQQTTMQEAQYGGGFAKNNERVIRGASSTEQNIQRQINLIPNKITYDQYKQSLGEYRDLQKDQVAYNKYIDYRKIKVNLLKQLMEVNKTKNNIIDKTKKSYLYSK